MVRRLRINVRRLVLTLAILLVGCGAAATPTPTSLPTPTPAPTRTDAEIAAVLSAGVDDVYCGSKPKPNWCSAIGKADKAYAIEVDGTTVFVGSKLPNSAAGKKLATSMCRDLAATHFDENGNDLGVVHFHVFDGTGSEIIADCNIPGY